MFKSNYLERNQLILIKFNYFLGILFYFFNYFLIDFKTQKFTRFCLNITNNSNSILINYCVASSFNIASYIMYLRGHCGPGFNLALNNLLRSFSSPSSVNTTLAGQVMGRLRSGTTWKLTEYQEIYRHHTEFNNLRIFLLHYEYYSQFHN